MSRGDTRGGSCGRGPERLLLAVGLAVGLLFALLYPPWAGGADEATHFARALEMAHGRLVPDEVDGVIGSPIPESYRRDQGEVAIRLWYAVPFDHDTVSVLDRSRPDWSQTWVVDTQPTLAATPLAYGPPAAAMAIPDSLGWVGVKVLWAGRIGNLLTYLAVAWLALRVATAFRWTLALAAVFPMNLGIAASVTPDALTISAFLLVVAVWTRVWRPPAPPVPPVPPASEPEDSQERALAALTSTAGERFAPPTIVDSGPEGAPAPAPRAWAGAVARLSAWTATPRGTFVMVLAAGLLLVATKPPYFLVLAAFPALVLTAWRDIRLRMAGLGAVLALLVGAVYALINSSGSYKAVTEGMGGSITYQPDVQQERLLSDPFGFLGRVLDDWFGHLDKTVQRWVRHVGYVEVTLPSWVSWAFVIAVVVAAVLLDRDDLVGLRRGARAIWAVLAAAMILALYTSSYLYFDDTVEGTYMGLQVPRYVAPFFAIAVMGWAPRTLVSQPRGRPLAARIPSWAPVALVVAAQVVLMVAAVRTWNFDGWTTDTS